VIAAVIGFTDGAKACVAVLSPDDIQSFQQTSRGLLQSVGRQRLSEVLEQPEATQSIVDWLKLQLCPYTTLALLPEARAKLVEKSDLQKWTEQADAFYQVQVRQAQPDLFSLISKSLQSYATGDGGAFRPRGAEAIDLLAKISQATEKNSSLGVPASVADLFGIVKK
jgi:hypothetical protein